MKIALLFSGQPRFVAECYGSILKNLISPNGGFENFDIFAHLWFDKNLVNSPYKFGGNGKWVDQRIEENAIDTFRRLYNPKLIKVDESKTFKLPNLDLAPSIKRYYSGAINNPLEPDFQRRQINNMLSQLYSLSYVNLLKKEYEFRHGFKYDWVIRCRTDNIVDTPLVLNNYDSNFLNFISINNQPDGMICDWLNWGSSQIMDSFMSCFNNIDYVIEKTMRENNGCICPELLLRKNLDIFGGKCYGHRVGVRLPRF